MKVSELIEALKQLPQDAEVIMSQDAEGNGYSPLYCLDEGTIRPEEVGQYNIESFYSNQHTDEDCCLDPGERDQFAKVVCLCPMN
jgi:hypothetical protein